MDIFCVCFVSGHCCDHSNRTLRTSQVSISFHCLYLNSFLLRNLTPFNVFGFGFTLYFLLKGLLNFCLLITLNFVTWLQPAHI